MIVSKFDTLQELRDHQDRTWSTIMANSGAAFQRDPGINRSRYDPVDAGPLAAGRAFQPGTKIFNGSHTAPVLHAALTAALVSTLH